MDYNGIYMRQESSNCGFMRVIWYNICYSCEFMFYDRGKMKKIIKEK